MDGLFGEGEEEEIDQETLKKLIAEGKLPPEEENNDDDEDADKSKYEPDGKRQKTDE